MCVWSGGGRVGVTSSSQWSRLFWPDFTPDFGIKIRGRLWFLMVRNRFIQHITVQKCVCVSVLCVYCTCMPTSLHVPKHLTGGAVLCLSSRSLSHCSCKRPSVWVLMGSEQACFDSCFQGMLLFLSSRFLGLLDTFCFLRWVFANQFACLFPVLLTRLMPDSDRLTEPCVWTTSVVVLWVGFILTKHYVSWFNINWSESCLGDRVRMKIPPLQTSVFSSFCQTQGLWTYCTVPVVSLMLSQHNQQVWIIAEIIKQVCWFNVIFKVAKIRNYCRRLVRFSYDPTDGEHFFVCSVLYHILDRFFLNFIVIF